MRRVLIGMWAATLPLAACLAQEPAEGDPCGLVYLGKELKLDPPAHRLGDECFLPIEHAKALGWEVKALGDRGLITSRGKHANLFLRNFDGVDCLPLRTAAQLLGGVTEWRDDGKSLHVLARCEWIGAGDGSLSVKTSFPVKPKVSVLTTPDRVVLDLPGTRYVTASPPVTKNIEKGVRMFQFRGDTLRVVCDLGAAPKLSPLRTINERQYELSWTGALLAARDKTGFTEYTPPPAAAAKPTGDIASLGPPLVSKESDSVYTVRLPTDRLIKGKTAIRRTRDTVEVEIPNAVIEEAEETRTDGGFLSRIRFSSKSAGQAAAALLQFAVTGAVGVNIAPGARELVLTLTKPRSASGRISEKIIVIDPGHGGSDPGAQYGTGDQKVQEKTVNLAVGQRVAKLLAEQGATVIMTRSDDSYPSLKERVETANLSEAHFFVSIHHNSNRIADSRSGTFTYYHGASQEGKLLAEYIQKEIAAVSGLSDHGAVADTTRFKSGMHVLRNTKMPAVLVEVAYINNATDRRLIVTEDFQQKVAAAIAKGIRSYLGDLEAEE